MKSLLIGVSCLVLFLQTQAQEFGGNPPSIHWKQVNTRAARVIFPEGIDSVATRVAAIAETLNGATRFSIGNKIRKINIVLQNQTTTSNGYVGLGPYRSEFYLTPPQNSFELGSLPWYKQLAIHEFRHVQQYNNFDTGLSRVFRILFGEEGQALANNLVVPNWFFEGDAVYNETNVSDQGRGRLASFFNDYRSLWSAGKNYSWMKLRNGSFRDFTPDHYRLGYMMVAYGRQKYGDEFWKKVTADAAAFRGLFYPFQRAVKRYSGQPYPAFRRDAARFFKEQYAETRNSSDSSRVPRHVFIDEEYPAVIDENALVFVKSSYKKIAAFTIRRGDQDQQIRVRDISLDRHFSYSNGKIVYSAYRPDLRWGWKDYGVIDVLDVTNGQQRTLTVKTKYFSPDISADGKTIVAVWSGTDGKSALHLLDGNSGALRRVLPNAHNYVYTYPKFADGNRVISAVRNPAGLMSLAVIDLASGSSALLLPFSSHVIAFPAIKGDTVFFSISTGETDRIYACHLSDRTLYEMKRIGDEHVTGDYQPAVGARSIYWSRFTADGQRIMSSPLSAITWKAVAASSLTGPLPDFRVTRLESNPVEAGIADTPLEVSTYHKTTGLINFHSLEPLVDDPDYSVSLVGENVLNTMQSELSVSYNRDEGYKQAGFNAIYGAWFPYVSGGVTYTRDRRGLYRGRRVYWNEWEWRGGANLPLNLTRGRHITALNIGADYVYNQPHFQGAYKDTLGDRSFGYVNSYLTFSNQTQRAKQQIYARFAQSLLVNYKRAASGGGSNQFLASGYLFLPGLSNNHSLVINAAYQQHDSLNQHSFTNSFPFSRGYTAENIYRMTKWGATYHFPLFYPDAGAANIVYLLRVRAAAFYDDSFVRDQRRNEASFRSTGGEIFFDTSWWNQLAISFGFRVSHLLDPDLFGGNGSTRFEFILPVNVLNR